FRGLVSGLALAVLGLCALPAADAAQATVMSYTASATAWNNGLPIGNGRMGAMIFGTASQEHLQFNEDTLWIGEPHDYSNSAGPANLPAIRNDLYTTQTAAAGTLITNDMLSIPARQPPYQPFGDLYFTGHATVTNYVRTLDLDQALSTVDYDSSGVHYRRE